MYGNHAFKLSLEVVRATLDGLLGPLGLFDYIALYPVANCPAIFQPTYWRRGSMASRHLR